MSDFKLKRLGQLIFRSSGLGAVHPGQKAGNRAHMDDFR